jgi:hypothetical protein
MKEPKAFGFCPCYRDFKGEILCVNDDDIIDIEPMTLGTDILGTNPTMEEVERFRCDDGQTCYMSIYTDKGRVFCLSQGWPIRIHGRDVSAEDLITALRLYFIGEIQPTLDCATCIYGILLALVMSEEKQFDSIKRYLDEFSLKIAVNLSELSSVEDEDEIDYFGIVRAYLVDLLEQQKFWHNVQTNVEEKEGDGEWLKILAGHMETLDRLQFQFYSQVLNIRGTENRRILVRMLYHILNSARDIYEINDVVSTIIMSDRGTSYRKNNENEIADRMDEYVERSMTIDHFFGNILDIMKST